MHDRKRPLVLGTISLIAWFISSPAVPGEDKRDIHTDRAYAAGLYRNLLDREPTRKELSAAMSDLRRAPARIAVHNRMLDSPGFRDRVDDATFLIGLYRQVRNRPPGIHEMLIGLHFLEQGVPRSEVFGQLLQPRPESGGKTPPVAARFYDHFLLDFGQRRLGRIRREARAFEALDHDALAALLREEIETIDAVPSGRPDRRDEETERGPDPRFNVYYGYIHAHTRVSLDALLQGSAGPFEAFHYARHLAKLDFLGLSDHGEFISTWPWNNEWDLLQEAADTYNQDGVFVALRGFEYSNPFYGHLNVFNTPVFTSAFLSLTLHQFYDWLARFPEASATFNHPGAYDYLGLEFLHFRYFPAVGEQLQGIELLTHNDQYGKYSVGYRTGDGLGYMDEAIRSGWRIGSVSAQDNHAGGWGTIDDYRTAVLAMSLTREGILDGLRRRRFYSTQDRNLVMSFRANNREMGSVLRHGPKEFTVTLDDGDGEGFAAIDFHADGRLLESRAIEGTGEWAFPVPAAGRRAYYYVLVTQEDGDQAMSAPIWVEGPGKEDGDD